MLVYTYKEVVFYTLFEICTKTSFRLTNILLTNVFYTKIPRSLQSLRYFILVLILL